MAKTTYAIRLSSETDAQIEFLKTQRGAASRAEIITVAIDRFYKQHFNEMAMREKTLREHAHEDRR